MIPLIINIPEEEYSVVQTIMYIQSKNYVLIQDLNLLYDMNSLSLVSNFISSSDYNYYLFYNYKDKYLVYQSTATYEFILFDLTTLTFKTLISVSTYKKIEPVVCLELNSEILLIV